MSRKGVPDGALTVQELLRILGVKSPGTIYYAMRQGTIPPPVGVPGKRVWWDKEQRDRVIVAARRAITRQYTSYTDDEILEMRRVVEALAAKGYTWERINTAMGRPYVNTGALVKAVGAKGGWGKHNKPIAWRDVPTTVRDELREKASLELVDNPPDNADALSDREWLRLVDKRAAETLRAEVQA